MEPYTRGFYPTYTRCWSRSRLVVPLSMIVDSTLISCLSWGAPLSIESSNSLSEICPPPPLSCHASSFSESVPSVSQSVWVLGRFPFACPPHSPLVDRVVNLEGARLLFRRVLDNLALVQSPLFEAGVLGRWGFLFLNQVVSAPKLV